jgi:Raf kinase inhibitor-like YbhB/YbcL family protein
MPQDLLRASVILSVCVASAALLDPVEAALRRQAPGAPVSFQLSSSAFSPNESIPKKFTCDGNNVSPQLSWTGSPHTVQSFALVMDDPDAPAGTWVHWILYNLPLDSWELTENVPPREQLPNGARQARNSFNQIGYGGPCPPPGKPHRYFFKLYALDIKLRLRPNPTKADVERAMQTHIVAQAELIGLYSR